MKSIWFLVSFNCNEMWQLFSMLCTLLTVTRLLFFSLTSMPVGRCRTIFLPSSLLLCPHWRRTIRRTNRTFTNEMSTFQKTMDMHSIPTIFFILSLVQRCTDRREKTKFSARWSWPSLENKPTQNGPSPSTGRLAGDLIRPCLLCTKIFRHRERDRERWNRHIEIWLDKKFDLDWPL